MNLIQMWRLWRMSKEVSEMDKKGLVKLFLVVAAASVGAASAQYVAVDSVSWTDLVSVAVTAAVAFLSKSPINKSE